VPIEGVDVYVTSEESTERRRRGGNHARSSGVFLRKITRGAVATRFQSAGTQLQRGDVVTLVGRTQDIAAATRCWALQTAT